MKRRILFAVIVLMMAIAGFAIARHQKGQMRFPAHTIVYRFTYFDETEKPVNSEIIIRRVESDGTWKHTQVRQDGSVVVTNGKLKGFLLSKQVTDNLSANLPEHLNYKYIQERNRKGDTDSWMSPDLQDVLLFTTFRADGSKETEMKAVDITRL